MAGVLDLGSDNGSGKCQNVGVEVTCFSDGVNVRDTEREE